MSMQIGKQSISFSQGVKMQSAASVVGPKEGEGPLRNDFDLIMMDPSFGEKTWEQAESQMLRECVDIALDKAKLSPKDIRYAFGGDLLGQLIATTFGIEEYRIPVFGLYSACATIGEALSLGAMSVAAGYGEYVLACTSSHFGCAEKQFRYPLAYGNQRPLSSTWTVVGAGCFILGGTKGKAMIKEITTGVITDYGIHDSMNMGACMAPAAANVICTHLSDFHRDLSDYDRIITGDLGLVGQKILWKLMQDNGYDIKDMHLDCGISIYDIKRQDVHSGGSGCGCSAVTLAAFVLPKIESGEWQRVLFVPTGALLSTVSYNEGKSVPGIAHCLTIEHVKS